MKYLYLEDLHYVLKIWEFMMLQVEVRIKAINSPRGINLLREYGLDNLPGSELNSMGSVTRPIIGYQNLRNLILKDEEYNPLNYIPRVPSKFRTIADQVEYNRSINSHPLLLFPMMLDAWLDTRRVFVMDKPQMIDFVNAGQENYLDKLPYESFVLNFNETFFFKNDVVEVPFSSILVSSDDSYIDFLAIPQNVEELAPSDRIFKRYEKMARGGKKIRPNDFINHNGFESNVLFTGYSLNKETLSIHTYEEESLSRKEEVLIYSGEAVSMTIRDDGGILIEDYEIFSLINGFAKLVSELKAKPVSRELFKEIDASQHYDEVEPFDWIKIPINQTYKISKNEDGILLLPRENLGISIGGTEKSPHVRRGHWRTITSKDGEVKRVWINQASIREDKLETEHLVGGATVLK